MKKSRFAKTAKRIFIFICGLIAGLIFALLLEVGYPIRSADQPMWCAEISLLCWVYEWQTLIAAFVAITGAWITVRAIRKQIYAAELFSLEERLRQLQKIKHDLDELRTIVIIVSVDFRKLLNLLPNRVTTQAIDKCRRPPISPTQKLINYVGPASQMSLNGLSMTMDHFNNYGRDLHTKIQNRSLVLSSMSNAEAHVFRANTSQPYENGRGTLKNFRREKRRLASEIEALENESRRLRNLL